MLYIEPEHAKSASNLKLSARNLQPEKKLLLVNRGWDQLYHSVPVQLMFRVFVWACGSTQKPFNRNPMLARLARFRTVCWGLASAVAMFPHSPIPRTTPLKTPTPLHPVPCIPSPTKLESGALQAAATAAFDSQAVGPLLVRVLGPRVQENLRPMGTFGGRF